MAIKSKIKYPTSNAPFGSAYEEHAAIKDTAAEVKERSASQKTSDSKRNPGVI